MAAQLLTTSYLDESSPAKQNPGVVTKQWSYKQWGEWTTRLMIKTLLLEWAETSHGDAPVTVSDSVVSLPGFKRQSGYWKIITPGFLFQSKKPRAEEVNQCFCPRAALMFPRTTRLSASSSAAAYQQSARKRGFHSGRLSCFKSSSCGAWFFPQQRITTANL